MTDKPHQDGDAFLAAVEEAIAYGGPKGRHAASMVFEAAARHVLVLLADAATGFRRGSYGTCVFLAITALEETAKAEIFWASVRDRLQTVASADATRCEITPRNTSLRFGYEQPNAASHDAILEKLAARRTEAPESAGRMAVFVGFAVSLGLRFLGCGKTMLIARPSVRPRLVNAAVIVNEFGGLGSITR